MLFYLHIPKTGGQTLAMRLASAYLPTRVYIRKQDFNFPNGAYELQNMAKNMDFAEGHVAGEVLSPQQGLRILTTIREPIEQIISSFRHIRREPENIWHRPANELGFELFFKTFSDNFMNVQTTYLVRSFFSYSSVELMNDHHLWLIRNMAAAIDRLHWLVPSEKIDEFVILWSIDEERHVPHPTINVNVSERDGLDMTRLRHYLRTRTDLYDLDLVLWHNARAWFERYRERVAARRVSVASPANTTRAFFQDGSGIWLTKGWYPASIRLDNITEWWAGPTTFSEIHLKRSEAETFLEFDIACILGFEPDALFFFGKRDGRELTKRAQRYENGDFSRVSLDISDLCLEDTIVVEVPRVLSSMQVSKTDNDSVRRSFATQGWRLRTSSSLDPGLRPADL